MTRRTECGPTSGHDTRVRLDKWLWAARFYRTRSLAAEAVETGHVRVDGERVKPAHPIRTAMRITIRKRDLAFEVDVLAVGDVRGPASQAALLYRETEESAKARERARAERAVVAGKTSARPTKRDRRRHEDFLNQP
jgi:ribosome-associated heat shock protein Hsp15